MLLVVRSRRQPTTTCQLLSGNGDWPVYTRPIERTASQTIVNNVVGGKPPPTCQHVTCCTPGEMATRRPLPRDPDSCNTRQQHSCQAAFGVPVSISCSAPPADGASFRGYPKRAFQRMTTTLQRKELISSIPMLQPKGWAQLGQKRAIRDTTGWCDRNAPFWSELPRMAVPFSPNAQKSGETTQPRHLGWPPLQSWNGVEYLLQLEPQAACSLSRPQSAVQDRTKNQLLLQST